MSPWRRVRSACSSCNSPQITQISQISLKVLQDVCDQGAGDIAGEAVERGLIFFEESGRGLAHLIFLPEDKVRISINHFLTVQVLELHLGRNLDLERGGAPGSQVKSDNP